MNKMRYSSSGDEAKHFLRLATRDGAELGLGLIADSDEHCARFSAVGCLTLSVMQRSITWNARSLLTLIEINCFTKLSFYGKYAKTLTSVKNALKF